MRAFLMLVTLTVAMAQIAPDGESGQIIIKGRRPSITFDASENEGGGTCILTFDGQRLHTTCGDILAMSNPPGTTGTSSSAPPPIASPPPSPSLPPPLPPPEPSKPTDLQSCKALFNAGFTDDGAYTVTLNGVQEDTWCDMTRDGGGWTLVANQMDTSSNCNTGSAGTFTTLTQSTGWRMSDSTINALGMGQFRYSLDTTIGTQPKAGSNFFLKNQAFSSSAAGSSAILQCSKSSTGSYTTASANNNFKGLSNYNAAACGATTHDPFEMVWCWNSGLFLSGGKATVDDAYLWFREN